MQDGFYHRYGLALIVCTALVAPLAYYASIEVLKTNSNDRNQWLPKSLTVSAEYHNFVKRFGTQESAIVSWPGCTLDDARLDAFADGIMQPPPGQEPFFAGVLTGRSLLQQMTSPPRDIPRKQAIERLEGVVVGPDLATTCAVIRLTDYGTEHRDAALARLRYVARERCALSDQQLRLGGSLVDIAATNQASDKLLYNYSAISAAISLAIACVCLRNLRLVMMLFYTALLATGVGMIVLWLTHVTMNILLMILPALWFTLSVSGAVHFINYYRDAAHEDPQGAAEGALSRGWLPCTLATLTTSIGLGSLMWCDIVPVFLFGEYSALGLMAGLGLLFLLLPSLLARWAPKLPDDQLPDDEDESPAEAAAPFVVRDAAARDASAASAPSKSALRLWRFWRRVTDVQQRYHAYTSLGFLAVMTFVGLGLIWTYPSAKLKDYFPPDSRIFRDYAWLERHVAPLMPLEVAIEIHDSLKMPLADRMRLVGEVESAIEEIQFKETGRHAKCYSAATLIPDIPPMKGLNIVRRRILLNQLEQNRQEFVAAKYIVEEPHEEIWRVTVRVAATSPLDYGRFADQVEDKVNGVINSHGDVKSGISTSCTGPVRLVSRVQATMWDVLNKSFLMAFVLIGLIMMLVLKSVPGGLVAMAPNIFPVMVCFGMMGWLGMSLDVGSLMTASVALGIAVDDTFHFLIWFTRARRLGYSRRDSVLNAYRHCGVAMTQTSMICGCGLLVFLLSEFNPAARFGGLMFAMLATALVGDLVFLPALLLGPAGRLFTVRARAAARPAPASIAQARESR